MFQNLQFNETITTNYTGDKKIDTQTSKKKL